MNEGTKVQLQWYNEPLLVAYNLIFFVLFKSNCKTTYTYFLSDISAQIRQNNQSYPANQYLFMKI